MNALKHTIILMIILFIHSCGSGSMTGTVVDAETGKPIEGAVIHAEWYKTGGVPGLTYGKIYKIEETETDKNGQFGLKGVVNPLVDPPKLVIYLKGYVAWRNDYIFPGFFYGQRREGFKWKSDDLFNLKRFGKYSHSRHITFITLGLDLGAYSKLQQAYAWEGKLATREGELVSEKRKMKKAGEYTENELWQEVVDELYSPYQTGKLEANKLHTKPSTCLKSSN